MGIKTWLLISLLLFLSTSRVGGQSSREPTRRRVIDVHMHVYASDPRWEKRLPNPATGVPLSATTEDIHRRATLEQMRRFNVILAVISNGNAPMTPIQQRWVATAPEKFIPAIGFNAPGDVTPERSTIYSTSIVATR